MNTLNKMWAWFTAPPTVPPDWCRTALLPDPELTAAMAELAAGYAKHRDLDFSLESLGALDADSELEATIVVGAYLGEVLVRCAPDMCWARDRYGEPGIASGAWLADPFGQVEQMRSPKPSSSFSEYAASLLAFATAESSEDGAEAADLRPKQLTQWQALAEGVRRRRRKGGRP